ncbi:hypothetical protein E0485_10295, partial [Paenibacillus albiflavus]
LTDITGFDKTKLGKQTLTVTIDGKSTTFEVTVEKKLVSIKVTTPPTKIIYNVGESLDPTGLVVTGTYDDDTTAIMNVTLTDITGFDKTKLGKQTLTVTIDGKSTTFEVTVEKKLVSIKVTTPPTKIIYNVGESLDPTGLVVTGTYDDDTTAIMNVTLTDITGFDKTKLGKQTLTVTIDGKSTTFEVTVEKKLVSIKVTTPPTKIIYNVGESLDPTGLVVTGTYDDDTTAIMNVTLTDITGFDKTKLGKQTLTVTIDGKSTTFEVTVEKKLVSIKVTTPPTKIIYNVGESLDPTGLVVTGTYDDDTTAIMNVTLTDITGFDKTKLGKQTLTVTIDGKSTTFEVTVEKKLVSIKVTTPPTKIIYNVGESLDPTGLVVTGTYDDDTTAIMNVTLTDITGFDKTKLGKQTLTVTIDGKSTTFEVTVEKKLVSIKVTTPPTKIIYNVGESLDPTGLVVTGTYDDDTTAIMNVTLTDITGLDKTKLGKQTLTVTIDGKTTTFEVTVDKKTGSGDGSGTGSGGSTNGGSTSSGTAGPKEEIITIDVENGANSGDVVSKATIKRTTDANGRKKDEVTYTPAQADKTIEQLLAAGSKSAKIVIPDAKDEVSELNVKLPKASFAKLADKGIDLEIMTPNGRIIIPADSMRGLADDMYFRLVPIKQENERKAVEQRAKTEEVVREFAGSATITVLGRPMTIETNMQSRPVTLVLPLPEDVTEDQLADLGVFIEHSDGEKEVVQGEIVPYDKSGKLGIQITINKFSTFTIIDLEGLNKQHKPYIYGYLDGTFGPEKPITRAEMAAMLTRVFDKSDKQSKVTKYNDVDSSHWASDAIDKATRMGIMSGDPDGRFRPEETITRGEMASVAVRLLGTSSEQGNKVSFPDIAGHWAESAIMQVSSVGKLSGYQDGTFRPNQTLSRAEAVALINMLLGRGPLTGAPSKWNDVSEQHWAYSNIQEASLEHTYVKKDRKEEWVQTK